MASWAPTEAGLHEILQTIRDSTDNNATVQREITVVSLSVHPPFIQDWADLPESNPQKLNNFTRAPEYIAYLVYILGSLPQEEDRIRTIAGYLLKNNARLITRAPPQVANYVKVAALHAFGDSSPMIRNAASQTIVAFLGILEPKNWPECLQHLFNMLESPNLEQQEVRHCIPTLLTSSPPLDRLRVPPWETRHSSRFPFQLRLRKFGFPLLIPLPPSSFRPLSTCWTRLAKITHERWMLR